MIIDYYHEGTLFGMTHFCEWAVCDAGQRRNVYLAVEESEVAVISFAALKNHLAGQPEILLSVLSDYCHRLAAAYARIEGFVLHRAEERLARALLLLAAQQSSDDDSVSLRTVITHEELAHLVGISRTFVSEIISRFRKRGLIESSSAGHIVVHCQKIASAFIKS